MEAYMEKALSRCKAGTINIQSDSRKIENGDIFIALPGENVDGSSFIPQALERGASLVICDKNAKNSFSDDGRVVACGDPHDILIELAKARYPIPENALKIIGISGTNGNTTCAYLLEYLFQALGHKTGVFGTITWRWPGHCEPARLTTPDVLEIHSKLYEMWKAGCDTAIMEVSSHSLSKKRVDGLVFDGAIFTNLTQDHLDFHKNMESYFKAKSRLFEDLPKREKKMAINSDDQWGRKLLDACPSALAYGLEPQAQFRQLHGKIIEHNAAGLILEMSYIRKKWSLHSHLVGRFNALNLLAVQALALEFGFDVDDFSCLEQFPGVCGRMERIVNSAGLNIFVDYAHTPDALDNVLKTLKEAGFRKIVALFGCGGNRDKSKRPLMGQVVAKLADIAILTSDNPRFEDPESIINDVFPGLKGVRELVVEADRRVATRKAIEMLTPEDALLIAGKGHEDYQIINGIKHHYSDQETVRELLNCN